MTEFEKMLRLLDAAWLLRDQIVPCLVGPPGIGKTAAVELHAERHGCGKVVKIVASRCVPSETVGMTMPDHEHRSMDIYNSMQLSSLEDGDVLFLDELLEADQFVLSTLLTVIESREMADGTPLPDIQIIAATNDTIPPEQLKGNIRQRFMFERFSVDLAQTHNYIMEKTGMDLPSSVLRRLTDKGGDYNFLTPRSLTKLCLWVDSAKDEQQAQEVAAVINGIWDSTLGTEVYEAWRKKRDNRESPEAYARRMITQAVADAGGVKLEDFDFDECSMSELYDMLMSLPEWNDVAKSLSDMEMPGNEDVKSDVEI